MDNKLYEQAIQRIREMNIDMKRSANKNYKGFDFELLERILNRLIMFSNTCSFCMETIPQIISLVDYIYSSQKQLDKNYINEYRKKLNVIINHMIKEHKLITKEYFVGTYMPIGLSLGVTFGIIFDNISMGISLGFSFGAVLGIIMDADAKKKGRTI